MMKRKSAKIVHEITKKAKRDSEIKDLNIRLFAESRALEIRALSQKILNNYGNHLAFQKLPHYMRRRAMSHNIKRIPKRLHDKNVIAEINKRKAPAKRPSRRYRRRPSNLLSEYERRKRRVSWLETHIWHAKRFKMVEKWNYRIPAHPNDKSFRACYRAVKNHCLMQDVTYESTVQVSGPRQDILDGLKHICSTETGLTFAAKICSKGQKQGCVTVYEYDKYPYNVVGSVTYIWKPVETEDASVLWISCHPSIYDQIISEVKRCFSMTNEAEEIQSTTRNISVTSLKNSLIKFRLLGPASNFVLGQVLRPISKEDCVKFTNIENKPNLTEKSWWIEYYAEGKSDSILECQEKAWSEIARCHSPALIPDHSVIALTVRDPRLLVPPKRTKLYTDNQDCDLSVVSNFSIEVSESPIWNETIRQNVKETKLTEQQLNELKQQQVVPGTELSLGSRESKIPVLLVQYPGISSRVKSSSEPTGYGSGWDVYIPSGWGMAFWISLVYRCVRVGGEREARNISEIVGQPMCPYNYPDSKVAKEEFEAESRSLEAKNLRKPPAKRPNFAKLGFPTPFRFSFEQLNNEWKKKWTEENSNIEIIEEEKEIQNYAVIRNKKALQQLSLAVRNPVKFSQCAKRKEQIKNESDILSELMTYKNTSVLFHNPFMYLILVKIELLTKGRPCKYGHVCLPTNEDLNALDENKNCSGPREKIHKDIVKKTKVKKNKVGKSDDNIVLKKIKEKENSKCLTGENKILSNKEMFGHLSRTVMGFVLNGTFNLAKGYGTGQGFCNAASLLFLLKQQATRKKALVLLRNPTSLQYRFAVLTVLV